MGFRSIVYGHIELLQMQNGQSVASAKQALADFPFDDRYPFKNIFQLDHDWSYEGPVIYFGHSFKEIEYCWAEWLWKFTQFLSRLQAHEACVQLEGFFCQAEWRLRPAQFLYNRPNDPTLDDRQWGVTSFRGNFDPSIDPSWLETAAKGILSLNPDTGKYEENRWPHQVTRWPSEYLQLPGFEECAWNGGI